MKSLKVVRRMPDTSGVVLVAPRRHRSPAVDQLPEGLLEWLLDGKVLRAERIREARDRLARGCQPDADEVAAAVLQETGRAERGRPGARAPASRTGMGPRGAAPE